MARTLRDYRTDNTTKQGANALKRGLEDLGIDATRLAHQQYAARCVVARTDPKWFIRHVLRDEETGNPVVMSQYHNEWQDLISEHRRSIIWGHVESGKTFQISIARSMYEIACNTNLRCVVVSSTGSLSSKILGTVGEYMSKSTAFRDTFPGIIPQTPWTSKALKLKRDTPAKDPQFQSIGLFGSILGARIDLLILDDVLTWENTRTPALRQKTIDWVVSTLLGRVTDKSRVVVVGNAYHPDDLMHFLASRPGYISKRYPITDFTGKSLWPERWSQERIERKRAEIGEVEFARQMMCVARSNTEARFKEEWINAAILRGKGRYMRQRLDAVPPGCRVYTGVDIGASLRTTGGRSVLMTIAVYSNGDREIINAQGGRMPGIELMRKIRLTARNMMSIVYVEGNATQKLFADLINNDVTDGTIVPVYTFETGRNKNDPVFGVESLAAEFASGKWIIPSGRDGTDVDPEVRELIQQLLYYDPEQHTGDSLMALWIAREGARKGGNTVKSVHNNLLSR